MNVQQRIQRTYRVALVPLAFSDGEAITVEVNLSYEPADAGPPNAQAAKMEAIERLRRLARQGRTSVTVDDIETRDWQITCARQTLVAVELDEAGKPVRRPR